MTGNCKDCLYYDICHYHVDEEMTFAECGNFKNKADFVEVVRCKDCGHYINGWCEIFKAESPTEDGFCCYGERVNYESSKTEGK